MKVVSVQVPQGLSREGQDKDVLEDKCLLLVVLPCFVSTYCCESVIGVNIRPLKEFYEVLFPFLLLWSTNVKHINILLLCSLFGFKLRNSSKIDPDRMQNHNWNLLCNKPFMRETYLPIPYKLCINNQRSLQILYSWAKLDICKDRQGCCS